MKPDVKALYEQYRDVEPTNLTHYRIVDGVKTKLTLRASLALSPSVQKVAKTYRVRGITVQEIKEKWKAYPGYYDHQSGRIMQPALRQFVLETEGKAIRIAEATGLSGAHVGSIKRDARPKPDESDEPLQDH